MTCNAPGNRCNRPALCIINKRCMYQEMGIRAKANVFVKRWLAGGLMIDKPISPRELAKALANPITDKEWTKLAWDREAADAFERLMMTRDPEATR